MFDCPISSPKITRMFGLLAASGWLFWPAAMEATRVAQENVMTRKMDRQFMEFLRKRKERFRQRQPPLVQREVRVNRGN